VFIYEKQSNLIAKYKKIDWSINKCQIWIKVES